MKKSRRSRAEREAQPRKIIRADKAPTSGYSLVVDGHFQVAPRPPVEAAEGRAGMALKNKYQMLAGCRCTMAENQDPIDDRVAGRRR